MKMITLVAVTVLAMGCLARHEGTKDAEAFLKVFYPNGKHAIVRCQGVDTDQNGYVSCTGKIDDKIISIECPNNKGIGGCEPRNSECRLSKGATVQ